MISCGLEAMFGVAGSLGGSASISTQYSNSIEQLAYLCDSSGMSVARGEQLAESGVLG
jgi:hypothetical protein